MFIIDGDKPAIVGIAEGIVGINGRVYTNLSTAMSLSLIKDFLRRAAS